MKFDALIVGAGVVGSAVAMSLARAAPGRVGVIDLDLEGTLSSSELNAGGVRATWVQPINIALSKASIEYFASHSQEMGYRACGYLWLQTPDRMPLALKARERQQAHGWEVQAWDVAELRRRVPFLDKTDDLAGATFSPRDGLVNPNLMKNFYRAQAREAGAQFLDRRMLRGARRDGGTWILECRRYAQALDQEQRKSILTGGEMPFEREELRADVVVNCAGAWAAPVADILGYVSPVHAVRRQICLFDSRDVDLTPYGMMVDTSGVYFHPEATNGLAGFGSPSEKPGYRYDYDGEVFFQDVIWPALYERATGFERLRHLSGWAGLYEVSPDESGIVGQAAQPGVFEAHSFSGHGVMQSYAAGLALAQIITRGRCTEFEIELLSGDRFARGREVRETLII